MHGHFNFIAVSLHRLKQAQDRSLDDRGSLIRGIEFHQGIANVKINRAFGYFHDEADLAGGFPVGGPAQHFDFARGQPVMGIATKVAM